MLVYATCLQGMTALHLAVQGQLEHESVDLLVAAGADINAQDRKVGVAMRWPTVSVTYCVCGLLCLWPAAQLSLKAKCLKEHTCLPGKHSHCHASAQSASSLRTVKQFGTVNSAPYTF